MIAYVPIVTLYCIWLPLTCLGRLEHIEAQREFFALVNHGSSPDRVSSFLSDSFDVVMSDDENEDEEAREREAVCNIDSNISMKNCHIINFSEEIQQAEEK